MSDRLFALRVFARVARTGSFSRSAREFGLSQPSCSRIVAELEREIGAVLFTRTTRAVTLTEKGAGYLARIEPILASLEEADHAARGTGELRGVLRVALSSSFGVREVIPRLSGFMELHPHLRIELSMSDTHQELVSEGIDVALRLGTLADSTATSRLLGVQPRLLVASPTYLARAGTPQTPADLDGHALIIGPTGVRPGIWTFVGASGAGPVRVEGRLAVSTNEGAVAAAVAGLGIASTLRWGCRAALDNGSVVPVLPDWKMESVELNAVFPAGRKAKPSARAFTDYLAQVLRGSA